MKNWINIVVFNQLNFKLLETILPSFRQHRVDLKFRGIHELLNLEKLRPPILVRFIPG